MFSSEVMSVKNAEVLLFKSFVEITRTCLNIVGSNQSYKTVERMIAVIRGTCKMSRF